MAPPNDPREALRMIHFWKYQGLGNDFILLEDFDESLPSDTEFVRRACDRSFGIGADGILYVSSSKKGDVRMRVMNADGTEAEMCGNGIRCVAKHLYDTGRVRNDTISIETLAGVLSVVVTAEEDKAVMLKVNMGAPILDGRKIPIDYDGEFINGVLKVGGRKISATAISMGNPHLVTFDPLKTDEIERLGPELESHPFFPRRTNVEFVSVEDGTLSVRVYERGAGWTMACGTGACASVVAAAINGIVPFDHPVEVKLPGGKLEITVSRDLSQVQMSGPAELVFEGYYYYKEEKQQ